MVIVGRDKLVAFSKKHADARRPIAAWMREVEGASWRDVADVKARYPRASVLAKSRVVFDIKGNKYRMLTQIAFSTAQVAILRVGTHAEYDRWEL